MASPALPFFQTKAMLSGASSQTAGAAAARGRRHGGDRWNILRLDDDELRRGLGRIQGLATTNATGSPTARMRSRTSTGRRA